MGAVVALRVGTWNLRHGRDAHEKRIDLGAVAARIAGAEVDVVAVQEVDRHLRRSGLVDQVADLARRLQWHGLFAATMLGGPDGMRPASPGALDDGGAAYGVGLLSRRPLLSPTTVMLPPIDAGDGGRRIRDIEPRVVLRAAIPTVAGTVGIAATHLSWLPWRAWRQARSIIDQVAAQPGPLILAGDLNLPRCLVREAVRERGWHVPRARATFPGRRPLVQLDHVLVRLGRVVDGSVSVSPAHPSDHCLVSAAIAVTIADERAPHRPSTDLDPGAATAAPTIVAGAPDAAS